MNEVDKMWQICLSDDLSTYDPYDVWKTKFGLSIKRKYYSGRILFRGVAGILYLFDNFINNRLRIGYRKQEYAIVRALSAQILHCKYKVTGKKELLDFAEKHINWLIENHLKSTNGIGWGLDFEHPVAQNLIYSKTTPFSTITPYVLETLISHEKLTNQKGKYRSICELVFKFFDLDIKVMERNAEYEVTSYGPFHDRRVVNSVSYTMYSLVILDKYFDALDNSSRIVRLFNYVKSRQLEDGSWYYSDEGCSFIDCFHSCIILKNLIKSKLNGFYADGLDDVISKGYFFIKNSLFDEKLGLCKRFAKQNKFGLITYDLYDNAEMLQCSVLMHNLNEANKINDAIKANFIDNENIYSSINILGRKQNAKMLRWAILPYLYSNSLLEAYESKN